MAAMATLVLVVSSALNAASNNASTLDEECLKTHLPGCMLAMAQWQEGILEGKLNQRYRVAAQALSISVGNHQKASELNAADRVAVCRSALIPSVHATCIVSIDMMVKDLLSAHAKGVSEKVDAQLVQQTDEVTRAIARLNKLEAACDN